MSTNILAHNMLAMNAERQLGLNNKSRKTAMERLSSGYKINRAADDASGLTMSEKMRKQIRGLDQGARNIKEGIGYCQVADGALNEISDITNRMEELAVKAINGTNSESDRAAIDSEIQELKAETERILGTTKYNEIYIWKGGDPKINIEKTGETSVPAVNYTYRSMTLDITNENAAAYPINSHIDIEADETNGIRFKWTGYNGKEYISNWKAWPEAEEATINDPDDPNQMTTVTHPGAVTVKVSDLMDYTTYPEARGIDGTLSYTTNAYASQANLVSSLNSSNTYLSVSPTVYHSMWVYDDNGNQLSSIPLSHNGISYTSNFTTSVTINYPAAVKSGRDMDNTADTSFAEADPSNADNINQKPTGSNGSYSGTWSFDFDFENIGSVTAELTGITYALSSRSEADRGESSNTAGSWWHYEYYSNGQSYPVSHSRTASPTDASGVVNALTNATDGLLTRDNDNDDIDKGTITMTFKITAASPFVIGNSSSSYTSSDIGSMTIAMTLYEWETVDEVMERLLKISGSDIFSTSSGTNSDSGSVGRNYGSSSLIYSTTYIRTPVYTARELPDTSTEKTIPIYTAPECKEDVKINITYPILRLETLGLTDTNVLTAEDAEQAIDDIQYAAAVINDERALFGAYQNRLEHAYNGTMNTVENTTASESRIRDSNMAELMYWYSLTQILSNAGESMLAQASKNPENIIKLLQ